MDASRLLQRKFAVPAGTSILAVLNDAAGLGFDFRVMVLIVASSLVYAAIEAAIDIARIKAGMALPTGVTSTTAATAPAAEPITKA